MDEDILKGESEFADAHYLPHGNKLQISPRMFPRYANPQHMWNWREFGMRRLGDIRGKSLLDLGCGMGEEAVYLAKLGAKVTAIDISEVGTEIARRRAAYNNLSDSLSVFKMAADPTEFPDDSFDIVHGLGILHHIGLKKGLAEVRRVLKPGGKGLFSEHMGDSPTLERLKVLIWGGRENLDYTEHERPLTWSELNEWSKQFRVFETYPFFLLSRLRKRLPRIFDHDIVRIADYYTLKAFPFLKRYVGVVVIYLEK